MRISDWSSDVCSSDLLALFFRGFDRLRQARALEACLRNQFIGFRHIGVMVLAVVVAESLLGDDIAESVFRIGEFGQYESHGIAPVSPRVEQVDRRSVAWGKSVSVRLDVGGRRSIKKKKLNTHKM